MGTADISGGDGAVLRAPKRKAFQPASRGRDRHSVAPTGLAIVLSALLCSAAFIAYDLRRSLIELDERLHLVAALAASEIAPRDLAAPRLQRLALADTLPNSSYALSASDGEILSSTITGLETGEPFESADVSESHFIATAPIAGNLGQVAVAVPHIEGLTPVMQRAGMLLVAILVLGLVVIGRGRKAERRTDAFQPMVETIPYGLARWNAEGGLICANAALMRLLRIEPEVLTAGCAYREVSSRIAGRMIARPVLDQSHQRVVEVEREDGSVILLDERPCPGGGFVTLVSDITERKAADRMLSAIREEQKQLARRYHEEKIRAEAASRAKTSFLAHLSHDIRTPLNHIIGFADLIGMQAYGPLGDKKYCDYVTDIKHAGERLLTSFAEILEYAELEGGDKTLELESVPVDALLEQTAARFAGRAIEAGVRLRLGERAAGTLLADRTCMHRMLGNLVDNALRFTPRGGEVRLAAWAAEDGVVLEVSDTGSGMSEEQLSRLSQPFVLNDAAFTRTHSGVGLGIAIARAIAELSGGRLAIDSMADIGTTVAVSLPLATGGEARPHLASAA